MKNLTLIIPALLLMGCSVQKEIDCCEMEKRQCDEFYPYHNCPNPAAGYWSRDYKRHVRQNWSYEGYYPNTQTVYYVPIEGWTAPPVDNRPTLSNTPRPERLGTMGERSPRSQNNNTRTTKD